MKLGETHLNYIQVIISFYFSLSTTGDCKHVWWLIPVSHSLSQASWRRWFLSPSLSLLHHEPGHETDRVGAQGTLVKEWVKVRAKTRFLWLQNHGPIHCRSGCCAPWPIPIHGFASPSGYSWAILYSVSYCDITTRLEAHGEQVL